MIITIKSLTEEGMKGILAYFPEREYITKTFENKQVKLIINKKFSNRKKDQTWIIWIIKDLQKEHNITNMIDYNMEVVFT